MALSLLKSRNAAAVWIFVCDCGAFIQRDGKAVRYAKGHVNCGCETRKIRAETGRKNRTHGFSHTRTYDVHRQMMQRCYNAQCKDYPCYGGRGVAVCDDWHDIATFILWCESSGYRQGLTIERRDVNGNYEPGNCTWVVNERQAANRRHHVFLTIDGVTKPAADWARDYGIKRNTIVTRLRLGWSHKDAVTKPVQSRGGV